jgi:predicted lysophospholipase L1 biosynthesis ABC-type transport system permease subunit
LIISYLVKGINKKIGILKALGIKDSIIIKIFVGGLAWVSTVALSISILVVFVINYFINKQLSNFLGFSVTRYKITGNVLAYQVLIAIVLFAVIFFIIKYKTTRISPKVCINKA